MCSLCFKNNFLFIQCVCFASKIIFLLSHLCCEKHRHKGWLTYQTTVNKELRTQFKDTSVYILDHRLLFDNPRLIKNSALEYRKLQSDAVHFEDYLPIAKNLLKML
jgi:hypothetical protein